MGKLGISGQILLILLVTLMATFNTGVALNCSEKDANCTSVKNHTETKEATSGVDPLAAGAIVLVSVTSVTSVFALGFFIAQRIMNRVRNVQERGNQRVGPRRTGGLNNRRRGGRNHARGRYPHRISRHQYPQRYNDLHAEVVRCGPEDLDFFSNDDTTSDNTSTNGELGVQCAIEASRLANAGTSPDSVLMISPPTEPEFMNQPLSHSSPKENSSTQGAIVDEPVTFTLTSESKKPEKKAVNFDLTPTSDLHVTNFKEIDVNVKAGPPILKNGMMGINANGQAGGVNENLEGNNNSDSTLPMNDAEEEVDIFELLADEEKLTMEMNLYAQRRRMKELEQGERAGMASGEEEFYSDDDLLFSENEEKEGENAPKKKKMGEDDMEGEIEYTV